MKHPYLPAATGQRLFSRLLSCAVKRNGDDILVTHQILLNEEDTKSGESKINQQDMEEEHSCLLIN